MFNRYLNKPLVLQDQSNEVCITWDQLYGYCGPDQLIATSVSYRLFEQAFRELSPNTPPRREQISLLTAFPGRGLLECIEMITRLASLAPHRLILDTDAGPQHAPIAYIGRFYFEIQISDKRKSFCPIDGFFDDEFRHQVSSFQNKSLNKQEYQNYIAFKWNKVQSIMNHSDNIFVSQDIPAHPYTEDITPSWFGLEKYRKLHEK